VALKTVPALVADIADAGAVAASAATPLKSEAGFGFVFTSVTGVNFSLPICGYA
jgi:hypothetical protein